MPGDDAPYKLRVVTETSARSAANEFEALTFLHEHGVAWAPEIFDYQATRPAYLVTRFLEGDSLDTGSWWLPRSAEIRTRLSERLEEMHRLVGDFHGHIGGTKYPTWRTFLDVRFWKHVHRCEAETILTAADIRLLERLYDDAAPACEGIAPRLLHGDVKPANIVVAPDGECHLVDYEITRFGDPDFEWVKMRWLSLRWPEYRREIADPLLDAKLPHGDVSQWPAKYVLYAVHHVCAILQFERDVNIATPTYRYDDLRLLLAIIRSRYG
ncbi:MAG TPA: aminoglycoside phosphotransferase family protein [Thermoanaerobaculia bacterium]|nr:aminoglycoside phosphotransferase family protein [Thermoanaerobaculia bacterium]